MILRNTKKAYGLVTKIFHWLMVPIILGMYGVGLWMEDLNYYHSWYKTAPHWHKSVGVLLVFTMLLRFLWRISNTRVEYISGHKHWERQMAKIVHGLFYMAVCIMFISGYFITTAKGDSLDIFNWFSLPAVIKSEFNLQDIAGEIHEICAHVIFIAFFLHAVGALKHHIIDKDNTLKRMLNN